MKRQYLDNSKMIRYSPSANCKSSVGYNLVPQPDSFYHFRVITYKECDESLVVLYIFEISF